MNPTTAPNRGTDGYYHPASETELVALVERAYAEGRRIRVRGAGHSCAPAIYTGGAGTDGIDLGAAAPRVTTST